MGVREEREGLLEKRKDLPLPVSLPFPRSMPLFFRKRAERREAGESADDFVLHPLQSIFFYLRASQKVPVVFLGQVGRTHLLPAFEDCESR